MRIGLLGGSFDPVHNAHVELARAARNELGLDMAFIMPSGEPPYKKCHASRADRLNMALRAAAGKNWLSVCDFEIMRPGETYAVDTLRMLQKRYEGAELVYILGADAAARVHKWRGADEVLKICRIACVARGAQDACPEGMLRLNAVLDDISSSKVRELVNLGKSIDGLVPENVREYISERGLYISGMSEAELICDLRSRLKPGRFEHTIGVAETAAELARLNGLAAGKAYIAGLIHDCAKNLTESEMLEAAARAGADADELRCPQVLHAPVGALVAQERYGVNDPEVLSAVRRHTIGGAEMSLLDMIVYVADFVEPGRRPFPGLDAIRNMARADVRRAAIMCAESTREYQLGQGASVHPSTELMITQIRHGGMNNG
jgi:nicotinate-nucleotide adenylyltransferase